MSWLSEAIRTSSNDVGAAFASTQHRQKIQEVRAAYSQGIDSVRGDPSLSELGKQQLIARAWTNARAEIARLNQADFDTTVQRYNALEKQVFGTAAASSGADAVSFRDAVDRAANLKDIDAAAALLGTAELSGDTVLAKAVVMRAWEARWDKVVDHYAVNHATVADKLAELVSLRKHLDGRAERLGGNIGGSVQRPTELANLTLAQISEYAAADPAINPQYLLDNKFSLNLTPQQQSDARARAVEEARARAARGE